MCANYEDISPPDSPLQKLPLLSPLEMRKVLTDFLEEPSAPQDEEEVQRFSGVLSDLPDLEGDCSILSLGWNEDLGLEKGYVINEETKDSSFTASSESRISERSEKVRKESPKEEISCWSKVKAREKVLPEPVPIQKGDLVEYLVVDAWFLVEVTGRGKAGGKNRNYLNVKYSDGSEGGVFIDKHQWRIVKREEVQEEERAEVNFQLPSIAVSDPVVIQKNVEKERGEKSTHEEILISESEVAGDRSQLVSVHSRSKNKKEERTRTKSENVEKQENVLTGAINKTREVVENKGEVVEKLLNSLTTKQLSLIRKGDILEYLVEEEGDAEDLWFLVEVLGRGKAGGKNRNYLNVRYSDASEGGVFIDKHQWRIVGRVVVAKGKLNSEGLKK